MTALHIVGLAWAILTLLFVAWVLIDTHAGRLTHDEWDDGDDWMSLADTLHEPEEIR